MVFRLTILATFATGISLNSIMDYKFRLFFWRGKNAHALIKFHSDYFLIASCAQPRKD
jgi:hypothetical protein